MTTPYIGFSNNTLSRLPQAKEGDMIQCPHCGKSHPLECATKNGKKTDILMFFKCNGKDYVGAITGQIIIGQSPDCSGEF